LSRAARPALKTPSLSQQTQSDPGITLGVGGGAPASAPAQALAATAASAAAPAPAPHPTPPPGPHVSVSPDGTRLLAPDGSTPLYLTGLNWFGFENGQTFFDGLWAGRSALTRDFEVVAWRVRLLGFNAVRVPFAFPDLEAPPANISSAPCEATTVEAVVASVARPGWGGLPAGVVVPPLVS